MQEALVITVQHGSECLQGLGIRVLVHPEQRFGVTGVQADDIAGFDLHLVGVKHVHQLVVADMDTRVTVVMVQVNHHSAALHASFGHAFDAQGVGT
ncbi:hypothetical protein D3C86_2010870 [compost metagenome]